MHSGTAAKQLVGAGTRDRAVVAGDRSRRESNDHTAAGGRESRHQWNVPDGAENESDRCRCERDRGRERSRNAVPADRRVGMVPPKVHASRLRRLR